MISKPKISFITTVFNEQVSILALLDSLANQTRPPNEIIITDAGSTDNTLNLIQSFKSHHPTLMIRIIRVININRSQGRNLAIKNAKCSIIAASDAGCTLEADWLEKITQSLFNHKAQVVAGAYLPITRTSLQQISALLSSVQPDQITKDFLPSSRSIAFTKSVWRQVGGYPEDLDTAEDLVFSQKLKQAGFPIFIQPQALVHWQPPSNFFQITKTFFLYSLGDGLAGPASPHFYRHLFKFIFLSTCLFFSLFFPILITILIITLSAYSFIKLLLNRQYLSSTPALLLFIPLSIWLKIITTLGFAWGLVKRFSTPP